MEEKYKKIGVFFIIILIIFLILNYFNVFYNIKISSKYNNKIYDVKSADGKVTGTIGTKTGAGCYGLQTQDCVYVYYNLILKDDIPQNGINEHATASSLFDSNYYYIAKIYADDYIDQDGKLNIEPISCNQEELPFNPFDDKKRQTYTRDELLSRHFNCGKNAGTGAESASNFLIRYRKTLYPPSSSLADNPDSFLHETQLKIYDVSNIITKDINGNDYQINDSNLWESKNKFKTYDFTITPRE